MLSLNIGIYVSQYYGTTFVFFRPSYLATSKFAFDLGIFNDYITIYVYRTQFYINIYTSQTSVRTITNLVRRTKGDQGIRRVVFSRTDKHRLVIFPSETVSIDSINFVKTTLSTSSVYSSGG